MSSNEPAILFKDVAKRYPGPNGEFTALGGINLAVDRGEIFGLLGPNGSGKTTTIEIMVGLRKPSAGTVRILNLDPLKQRDELRRLVAIQPQHAAVFEQQTVLELLSVWASFYQTADDTDSIIARLGLQGSKDVRIAKLSGGQRQRVLVGLALVSNPQLLILDEPSTGMDPNARQDLWTTLRDYRMSGGTVLLSTHSMEEAETLCDRVAMLYRGKSVACATPAELIREYAPWREIFFTIASGSNLAVLETHAEVLETTSRGANGDIRVRLRTTDSDSVFQILASALKARQIEMKDAGLESVFHRLTGRTFTDAELESDETANVPREVVAS